MKTLINAMAGIMAIGAMTALTAAPAAARDNDRRGSDYRHDTSRYGSYGESRHGRGVDSRQAVRMCVRAVENDARRHTYGRADVTDVRKVKETRRGYEVRGRIAVNARDMHRRAGWNSGQRGYDSGSFSCTVEYGRIADIDYKGIRGLG